MSPHGVVLQVRDRGVAALELKAALRVVDQRDLNIEGHAGSGRTEKRIAALPSSPHLVGHVVADLPVPRQRQEWSVRALETVRGRGETAGCRSPCPTLLRVDVVAKIVLLLVRKHAFAAVLAVDTPIIARGEPLSIGICRT